MVKDFEYQCHAPSAVTAVTVSLPAKPDA